MNLTSSEFEDLRIIAYENGSYAHCRFYLRLQSLGLTFPIKSEDKIGYRFVLTDLGRSLLKTEINN